MPRNLLRCGKVLIVLFESLIQSVSYTIQPPVRTNINNVLMKSQCRQRTRIVHDNRLKTYYGAEPYRLAQI